MRAVAAIPEAVATQPPSEPSATPSSEASASCRAVRVGLSVREYS